MLAFLIALVMLAPRSGDRAYWATGASTVPRT
jgi:hypothetical protein